MASLSNFGYERRSIRQQLLSKLICKVLCVQPGEDNHELALEFCLHSTEFHRFGDTNPKAVDEQYDSLQARMVVNAQFGKQKALQQLRTLFLQQPLNKETLEVHHRVLSALLSLSRQPLQHKYSVPLFLGKLSPNSLLAPGEGEYDAGSDVSELSAWDDETAAGQALGVDELSDWSEDDSDLITARINHAAAAPPGAKPGSPAKPSKQLLSESWDFEAATKIRLQPAAADDSPAYEDGCLLRLLASTRARGLPFVTPSTRLLFTEQDLVLQVLHMLRGSPSPGRALTLNPYLDAYEVTCGAHVAHLSLSCLRNMLSRFSRSGTISYRLHMFVRAAKTAAATPLQNRMPAVRAELAAGPTLAAFAAAVADELAAVQSALIGVQEDFAAHLREGGNSAADVGLLALEAAVQAPMRRLDLLEAAVSAVEIGGPGRESAAGQAAALLDGLYAFLRSLTPDTTPQGQAEVAVALRLLMRVVQPLLDALETWLDNGLLTNNDEFFICSAATEVAVAQPSFWHSGAFRLRKGTDGIVTCPAFLRPLSAGILTAGKSALLLRLPQHQPCGPGAHQQVDATPEGPGRASLYRDILLQLEHIVSVDEEELDCVQSQPATRREPTIADKMAACSKCNLTSPCTYLEVGAYAAECAVDAFSAEFDRVASMHQPPGHADIIAGPLLLPSERGWGLACHLAADISADSTFANSSCGPPTASNSAECRTAHEDIDLVSRSELSANRPASISGLSSLGQADAAQSGGEECQRFKSSSTSRRSPGTFSASSGPPGVGGVLGDFSVLGDVSNLSLSARRAARSALPKEEGRTANAATQPQQAPVLHAGSHVPFLTAVDLSTINGVDQGLKDWYTRILEAMRNPRDMLDPENCIASGAPSVSGRASREFVPASVQATLIRSFSGRAVQQMWGDKWGRCGTAHDEVAAWLAELRDAELPPVDVAMQECVLAPIKERVDRNGRKLLRSLMGSQNLRQQLAALHNVYLLASHAMQPFQESLFRLLAERGDKWLEATGPGVLFELQGSLEQCLADERGGAMLPAHAVTLEVVAEEVPAGGPRRGNTIAALQPLRLKLRQHWPLSLIVQDSHMEQYNDVLAFLLQVNWARAALQGLQSIGSPGTRGADATDALSWQMSHCVMQLHTFVMDSLMHTALPQLSQALEAAQTLDDVAVAHDAFLVAATRAAMVAKERTWLLMLQGVCRLLDLVLRFADVAKEGAQAADKVADISVQWQDKHRYLMRLLTACTLRSGGFASLERLAARLDFNCFYADTS